MTKQEMVRTLIDKGHNGIWAKQTADGDYELLKAHDSYPGVPPYDMQECSVCRRWFTDLQMKYHYHPCE